MPRSRQVRLALLVAAAALLAIGLSGPVRRALAPAPTGGAVELAPAKAPEDAARSAREARYRDLLRQSCTETSAREAAGRLFATSAPPAAQPLPPQAATRLPAAEARRVVQARMREVSVGDPGWIGRMRSAQRTKVLADYLEFAFGADDQAICVWRVEGERPDGSLRLAYTLDVWLAPTPDLTRLAADPASYAERAR